MLSDNDVALLKGAATFVGSVAAVLFALRDIDAPAAKSARQLWLSTVPQKRWAEEFFLKYSLVWISWFAVVVLSGVWEYFGPWSYMNTGLLMCVPCFVAPLWLEPAELRVGPLSSRYWVKANAWIAIFSYVGNYFWTHYFYRELGASYTFSAHRINDVPLAMFLMTHAYFCTYHTVTTAVLRRYWTSVTYATVPQMVAKAGTAALVFTLAYITAWTEGVTISGFPYYHIENREWFYTVGSFLYGIYFVVSFPMYARMGEEQGEGDMTQGTATAIAAPASTPALASPKSKAAAAGGPRRKSVVAGTSSAPTSTTTTPYWSLSTVCIDSLGASMLVTILLDLWRLAYAAVVKDAVAPGMLPWVPK